MALEELEEYFNQGREQEKQYEEKQRARARTKKVTARRPAPWSFAGIIIGAGVFYQIVHPYLKPLVSGWQALRSGVAPIIRVIRADIGMLVQKIRGINPKWEQYSRFEEMARGKK